MTHNIIIRHLVFPCIPGRGRRPRRSASRRRLRWRPRVRGAPGRRALPYNNMFAIIRHLVFPCIPGRGRRPRRPTSPLASPLASPCARRAGTSRPTIITWLASCCTLCSRVSLVGADVPGGPRPRWRLRWRPRVRGAPWTSRPTIITWLAGTLCSRAREFASLMVTTLDDNG